MDKSRQQFEKAMAETMNLDINEIIRHRDGDKYQSLTVSVAWHWWQASRESLVNSLPESINCPTAPELIWLQVDPEPEEINKPEFPVNLYSDDVTWCADRIHPTDTLYIRADLIQK